MNIIELNQKIDELRASREPVHAELNDLVKDESITVGERNQREAELRGKIKEINESCYPLEIVRGKMQQIIAGKQLSEAAQEEYQRCVEIVGEITLG